MGTYDRSFEVGIGGPVGVRSRQIASLVHMQ
eukprot:SAG11_NODE_18289_length_495_cov_1.022727_2_plen_30_part_01